MLISHTQAGRRRPTGPAICASQPPFVIRVIEIFTLCKLQLMGSRGPLAADLSVTGTLSQR